MTRFPIFATLLLLSTLSYGQAWSGVIAPSRAIDWSHAGLPASLPDGETTENPWTPPAGRTQCGATIASGASVSTINSAIASCGSGHYVLLGAGTFTLGSSTIDLSGVHGVTLRGSGPQSTFIDARGSGEIRFGITWNNGSATVSSGLSQGSTSVVVSSISGAGGLVPGELMYFSQDNDSVDGGGLYVCSGSLSCAQQSTVLSHQQQLVRVTSITGSGPYTVNFTPSLYMPNWTTAKNATINWSSSTSGGGSPEPYGNGLEDLTVLVDGNSASDSAIFLARTYSSWIKGVRILGIGASYSATVLGCKNCLFFNNYIYAATALGGAANTMLKSAGNSDVLFLNNILTGGVPWEGEGSNEGNVVAYNYSANDNASYYEGGMFEHSGGSAFALFEANQIPHMNEDNTFATHNLNTWFRNDLSGCDPPFGIPGEPSSVFGINFDPFSRFENAVGNVIGGCSSTPTPLISYQTMNQVATSQTSFGFNNASPSDSTGLTFSSSLRWGNCDTVTGTCRFQSSEIPTSLPGNASPFQSAVPANQALPTSLFLSGMPTWWKVCTSWTTFPTNCANTQTRPFPVAGPDVNGGPYVNGHAYDIPAAVAFQSLPIDPAYQKSYSITSSGWSNGTETLTVSGLPTVTHLIGGFQITGASACNSPSGGEFIMTASTSTTISYALSSNPGSCAGGTLMFPNVRKFDEAVYAASSSGSGSGTPPSAPSGLSNIVQ